MKFIRWNSALALIVLFCSSVLHAKLNTTNQHLNDEIRENLILSDDLENQGKPSTVHFTIDEVEKKSHYYFHPLELIEQAAEYLSTKMISQLQLLQFIEHSGPMENPNEPYKREKHFGRWVRDPRTPKDCRNIRSKVLERDSLGPVQTTPDGCVVTRGEWRDPYAGRTYTDSRDIQIDHFVPLKNAYISGGFRWSQQEKCLYANYMGNQFHLLAVEGVENNNKSDSTPEKYMPPKRDYRCEYLNHWLKIKLIWSLSLTEQEVFAIRRLIKENQCSLNEFVYSVSDLTAQRKYRQQNLDLCQ